MRYCAELYPNFRGLICRKVRADLTESGLFTLEKDVLGRTHPLLVDRPSRKYRQSYQFDNGAALVIGGLDKPGRMLSTEYDLIYFQQAEETILTDWETLITRLRNGAMPFQQIIADCNPAGPSHWLKQRAKSGAALMLESRHQDNPVLWDLETDDWTQKGQEYIEKLDRLTGHRKQRLRFGLWAQAEGAVYDNFDPAVHVGPAPSEFAEVIGAVDWGYANPACILIVGLDGDGRAYVVEEWYHSRKRIGEIALEAKKLADKWGIRIPLPDGTEKIVEAMFFCDPSEPANIYELVAAGVYARGANNAVQQGIQVVKARLAIQGDGRPRLIITPGCVNLIAEMESYCWRESRLGLKDEPEKMNDHAVDTLRYGLMGVERSGVYFM